MFTILLFILWICMIVFSIFIGVKNSHLFEIKAMFNFTRAGIYNYTFGIHHSAFISQDRSNGKYRIETLSIGIILLSIEVNFYKKLYSAPIHPEQN